MAGHAETDIPLGYDPLRVDKQLYPSNLPSVAGRAYQ